MKIGVAAGRTQLSGAPRQHVPRRDSDVPTLGGQDRHAVASPRATHVPRRDAEVHGWH